MLFDFVGHIYNNFGFEALIEICIYLFCLIFRCNNKYESIIAVCSIVQFIISNKVFH